MEETNLASIILNKKAHLFRFGHYIFIGVKKYKYRKKYKNIYRLGPARAVVYFWQLLLPVEG